MRLAISLPILLVLSACTGMASHDATHSPSTKLSNEAAEPTATARSTPSPTVSSEPAETAEPTEPAATAEPSETTEPAELGRSSLAPQDP
jgi:hypothetical protein